jgi:tetratricopeptide (TPR) repeat protein
MRFLPSIVLAVASAVSGIAEARVHMVTTETTVAGSREIETRQPSAGIRKSLAHVASDRPGIRAAALSNLCIGYAMQREFTTAVGYCDRAVAEGGGDLAVALTNRGAVFYLAGNLAASIADLEQALQHDPGVWEARRNLTRARRSYELRARGESSAQLAQD